MNRRSLLASLAALPFIGALIPKAEALGDGVALTSIAHPNGAFATYALAGETVTCENGHPICDFANHICAGDFFRESDLENWRQEKPKIGQLPMPRCAVCGGRFCLGGNLFHIGDSWRDPHGFIAKYGISA